MSHLDIGIDVDLRVNAEGFYDLQINEDGDIATKDAFDTAIIISLLTDKRADASEVPAPQLRRGWIGNEFTPGFEIGSKIWLFESSRKNREALNGIADAARECLEWLVEDNLAVSIQNTEATLTENGLAITVTIERPTSEVEQLSFQLWENTGS